MITIAKGKESVMKRVINVLIMSMLCLGLSSLSFAQKQKVSRLFVLSASSGEVQKVQGHYLLKLDEVDPRVLWFTDRPIRHAGFVPTKRFIAAWDQSFGGGDSPNAAMVHVEVSAQVHGKQEPMAMALDHPVLKGNHLEFTVNHLQGDKILQGRIQHVRLFIDNAFGQAFCPNGVCSEL